MLDRLTKALSSYKTMVFLFIGYAVLLAVATVMEKLYGTPAAKTIIYHSPLLFIWQFLLVLNFIFISIKRQLYQRKRWSALLLHLAFVVILLGATLTFVFGKEGVMHLREGEISNIITLNNGGEKIPHKLPFSIGLCDFRLTRYPGSQSPSSFESDLIIYSNGKETPYTVFMNNILDMHGYRFFQASYDKDELGTILSVNQDVAGRIVSYSGYFLLFLSLFLFFFDKKSRFQTLKKELSKLKTYALFVPILLFADSVMANPNNHKQIYPIPKKHIKKFACLPIQSSRGRVMPMSTFASEILRKVHKENSYKGLSPEEFLLNLLVMPENWIHEPFIQGEKSYIDMFDKDGNYKFQNEVSEAYHKSVALRNSYDKEIIKQDEKVQLIHSLLQYRMLRLFPNVRDSFNRWYSASEQLSVFTDDEARYIKLLFGQYLNSVKEAMISNNWELADSNLDKIRQYQIAQNSDKLISDKKIKMEVLYNKLDVFRYGKISYLISGGVLLLLLILSFIKNSTCQWEQIIRNIVIALIGFTFIYHSFGLGLRWYIAGHAPWSNSYETMLYVAWASVLGGLFFARFSLPALAISSLFGGIILFVSGLNWLDPQISPLVPVLQSVWLMFHVATVVAAYGFFGIGAMLSITNLIMMSLTNQRNCSSLTKKVKELTLINEMSLWIGLALMCIGTFLGAIWANESWGRYWSWDPKETWALITVIVYTLVLHLNFIKHKNISLWLFNTCSQFAILSVLMTYFGVNYFLSGMHSYGNSDALSGIKIGAVILVTVFFIMPSVIAYIKYQGWKTEEVRRPKLED